MNTYASAELVLQVLEQVHDAGLDRHVERRHRLVEHEQLRVERSARAMPMRWRCPPENSCGNRFTCSGFSPTSAISSLTRSISLPRYSPVDPHRLADDRPHRHARVRATRTGPGRRSASCARSSRRSAPLARRARPRRGTAPSPTSRSSSRRMQPAGRRLAAARLPHDARASRPRRTEKLTPDTALHRPDLLRRNPGADRELLHEVAHLEDRRRPCSDGARRGRAVSVVTRCDRLALVERRPRSDTPTAVPAPTSAQLRPRRRRTRRCRSAYGHRGWNAQPGGRKISDGGCPTIRCSRSCSSSAGRAAAATPAGPACTDAAAS